MATTSRWKGESQVLRQLAQDETATVVASKKRVASLTRHPTCIIREEKGEGRSISQFGRWVRQRLKEAPAVSVSDEDSSYKTYGRLQDALAHRDSCLMKQEWSDRHLWRIFAYEVNARGARRFLSCYWSLFEREYLANDPSTVHAHWYEVIEAETPVRLYFDMEFDVAANPNVRGEECMQKWKQATAEKLRREYPEEMGMTKSGIQFFEMDSSTGQKFSRHIIVHGCPLFKDVCHAGSFVKSLAWELRNEEWAHVQPKKNDNISPLPSNDGGGDACCATSICPSSAFISIADLGVYTRNRCFRILGSRKWGKDAVLRCISSHGNSFPVSDSLISTLRDSLVVPVSPWPAPETLLTFGQNPRIGFMTSVTTTDMVEERCSMRSRHGSSTPKKTMFLKSPFPQIDEFLAPVLRLGGAEGYIRRVEFGGGDNSVVTFQVGRNRFCQRIQRQHKSNHIYLTVDLTSGNVTQHCHDPDCSGFSFVATKLPSVLLPSPEAIAAALDSSATC